MIICDDADLAAAASAASMGRFYNCGQACLAIKRVYVFESVADEVIEAITAKAKRLKVGRGDAKGTQMGPMHTAGGRDEVAAQVSRTLQGRRRAPGRRRPARRPRSRRRVLLRADGRRRPAARLADGDRGGVRAGAPDLAREPTSTRRSSAPTRPRSASGPRSGRETSSAPARPPTRIEAGYTWINSRTKVYDELPFGGWKSSGYGKEHGEEAFDFYTETKSVVLGARMSRARRPWDRATPAVAASSRSTARSRASSGSSGSSSRSTPRTSASRSARTSSSRSG